jgi:hypothetical protein
MSGAHGTWTQTGGGGPDLSGLIPVAVAGGVAVAVAVVVRTYFWEITGTGVIVLAAAAVAVWRWHKREQAVTAELVAWRAEREERDRRAALAAAAERHQRALELAAASRPPAPVIEITNVIPDQTAAIIAAAMNARQSYTAQAQPQPARVTIRGELEQ